MERGSWTDERLDDRFDALRVTLIRVAGGMTIALVAAILVRGA